MKNKMLKSVAVILIFTMLMPLAVMLSACGGNDEFTVTCPVNLIGGAVSADKAKVEKGGSVVIAAAPDARYELDWLKVNGEEVTLSGKIYTAENVRADVNVTAAFKKIPIEALEGKYKFSSISLNGAELYLSNGFTMLAYYTNEDLQNSLRQAFANIYYKSLEEGIVTREYLIAAALVYLGVGNLSIDSSDFDVVLAFIENQEDLEDFEAFAEAFEEFLYESFMQYNAYQAGTVKNLILGFIEEAGINNLNDLIDLVVYEFADIWIKSGNSYEGNIYIGYLGEMIRSLQGDFTLASGKIYIPDTEGVEFTADADGYITFDAIGLPVDIKSALYNENTGDITVTVIAPIYVLMLYSMPLPLFPSGKVPPDFTAEAVYSFTEN